MKKNFGLIVSFLLSCACTLNAQVSLRAVPSLGCGQLEASFSFQPALDSDTVTSIVWDFGNGSVNNGDINPTALYTRPGQYDITVTINQDLVMHEPAFISVLPLPDPDFYYSDTLGGGDYAFVFSAPEPVIDSFTYSFKWTFEESIPDSGSHVIHDFGAPGNYMVSLRVEDSYGCADSLEENIRVNEILELPNIFTPNGDGVNDYFTIRTNGINFYLFSVYTRSGILVYKSESPYISWDGRTFSGQELHSGIYYFTIRQVDGENPVKTQGFLQLIR